MKKITPAEWRKIPAEYKGWIRNTPYVLDLNEETGDTELVPVEITAKPKEEA